MALFPCGSANGGGGGGTYTTTVLFTNGASGVTTFQLSSAYTNFDAIAIYYSHFDGQDQYEDVRIYPTTFLNSVSSTDEVLGFTNDAWYYYFSVYSTTEFRYVKSNAGYITDIIGIKYGSNSGGGGDVTGVKGDAESTYRTGNVNITPANIGLGNVDNTSDLNKPISTATQTALNGKVDTVVGKGLSTNDYDNTAKGIVDGVTSALAGKVDTSLVGSANGVAELDANGRVPSAQLPSYVDDVLEYADLAHFPATGETGKIYIAVDTGKTYRWSGSDYAEISESLALGETNSTAYAGNKGKANADAIAAIKDGTNIDSFGDVETALAGKANSSDLGDKSNLTTTDKSSAVAAINELVSNKCNNLITQWFTVAGQSMQPHIVSDYDIDITKSGYTALSVAGFYVGAGGDSAVVSAYIRSGTSARVRILNTGSTAETPNDINICILYSAN